MIDTYETKHLRFIEKKNDKEKVTKIFIVMGFRNAMIGEIYWFGNWGQYCLFPVKDTVWSHECLSEVSEFVKNIQYKHINSRSNVGKRQRDGVEKPQ